MKPLVQSLAQQGISQYWHMPVISALGDVDRRSGVQGKPEQHESLTQRTKQKALL